MTNSASILPWLFALVALTTAAPPYFGAVPSVRNENAVITRVPTETDQMFVSNADTGVPEETDKYPRKSGPLFQGDMAGVIQSGETVDGIRNRLSKTGVQRSWRWEGGRVPYVISSAFTSTQREMILDAINYINAQTDATRWIPRTTHTNYVHITNTDVGCYSYVGVIFEGSQVLNLAHDCFEKWLIVHEMTHAIGFQHEQTRSDRDLYVDIVNENIQKEQRYNYEIVENTETFGLPYDLDSVMHYMGHEFAVSRNIRTIRAKSPYENYPLGNLVGYSKKDLMRLNGMYPLCATAYKNYNLTGDRWTFGQDDENNLHSTDYDTMSSVQVTSNCTLTICKSTNYQGQCLTLISNEPNYYYDFTMFDGEWDNLVRSYKCQCQSKDSGSLPRKSGDLPAQLVGQGALLKNLSV